jgi:Holliday junction resolvase RusA-like endonuclease
LSEAIDPDIGLPFPIEFLINDTPRSHQSKNNNGKEWWKLKVGQMAKAHVDTLREWVFLDERPLAATVFYFPPAKMDGDVDNIVKLILDGMKKVIYLEDSVIERVTVQKFEPGTTWTFRSLTSRLEEAMETELPVFYIRIDDDLSWRDVA